ncbi:MAG: methionine gamma-lyase family protein [Ruminococcus sp.]|nr:methionine gamma-lyase family protein [Candidatus Apopatosoma intestinale]
MKMQFSDRIIKLTAEAERELRPQFDEFDRIAYVNTARVLEAFSAHRVSEAMFAPSTGYGYGDIGRDALDAIYADVFGAEAAFVRHNIVNGTQAIAIGLFGLLRPGDVMLSVTGKPYDTLNEVIGADIKNGDGSLADFGIKYDDVDLLPGGGIDYAGIEKKIAEYGDSIKVIFIQRSKGYMNRPTLAASEIGEIIKFVKARCRAYVAVDNCYGEFCDEAEPTAYGADLIMGSLIKNPGGGMAECGGYIAGTKRAVELASYRQTTVGIGTECGATIGQNRNMFKGFFYAPHTVDQAKKTAALAAYIFDKLGYPVEPAWSDERHDIIQTVRLGTPEGLCAFCRGIQSGSPVDAYVTPEPWDMPGYADKVIMAAGTFVSGASIELSADGPLRPPYTAFFQGGLTYESGKYAIMTAADMIISGK